MARVPRLVAASESRPTPSAPLDQLPLALSYTSTLYPVSLYREYCPAKIAFDPTTVTAFTAKVMGNSSVVHRPVTPSYTCITLTREYPPA